MKIFPGAEGYGTHTVAGRGGQIIKVTNTNDSGAGSFRAAVTAAPPRIVVFETSGTIYLQSPIFIRTPYLTIAGQTAPSPGIIIRDKSVSVGTHDVLIQHIKFAPGDIPGDLSELEERDGLNVNDYFYGNDVYNLVIDHCTIIWGVDELVGTYGYSYANYSNMTFSNCIISEGINMGLSNNTGGRGFLVGDHVQNITIKNCLISSSHDRNGPLLKGNTRTQVVNNLVYNPGPSTVFLMGADDNHAGPIYCSAVGNVWHEGPSRVLPSATWWNPNITLGLQLYLEDNLMFNANDTPFSKPIINPEISFDPRVGFKPTGTWATVTQLPSSQVENYVLQNAGARPIERDSTDTRLVAEPTYHGGSMKYTVAAAGGYPTYAENYRSFDEGTFPHNDDDSDGYTNIEEILHSMAAVLEGGQTAPSYDVDVGGGAFDYSSNNHLQFEGNTYLAMENPANATGTIDHIEFYVGTLGNGQISVFSIDYDGNIAQVRESVNLTATSTGFQSFDAPNDFQAFNISQGDYIGVYTATGGCLLQRNNGTGEHWYKVGDYRSGQSFSFDDFGVSQFSIYATGQTKLALGLTKLTHVVTLDSLSTQSLTTVSTFVHDTFTGSDSTLLTNHTGEVGATWSKHPARGGSGGNGEIINNQVQFYSDDMELLASGTPATNEYDIEFDVNFHTAGGTGYVGVLARDNNNATWNCYMLLISQSARTFDFYKITDGSASLLTGYTDTFTEPVTRSCKLEIKNANKRLFIDGVQRFSTTENTYQYKGQVGIRLSGGTANYIRLDNFKATVRTTVVATQRIEHFNYLDTISLFAKSGTNLVVSKSWHTHKADALTFPNLFLYFAKDSFTATNNTLLQNHADDLGNTWVKHPAAIPNLEIYNNKLRNISGLGVYYNNAIPNTDEYIVFGKLTFEASSAGRLYLCGRIHSVNDTYYCVYYYPGDAYYALGKIVNGIMTVYATWSYTPSSFPESHLIKFEITNAYKRAYIDGVLRLETTDNSLAYKGYAGIALNYSQNITGDDFYAINIAEINFYLDDVSSTHSLENISSTSAQTLPTVNDLSKTQVLDSVSLTRIPPKVLVVRELLNNHSIDNVVLKTANTNISTSSKTITWLFDVTDSNSNAYQWSTITYSGYSFKIVDFAGITLNKSHNSAGLQNLANTSFTIVNKNNTLVPSDFVNGFVTIALLINSVIERTFSFVIKNVLFENQKFTCICEDYLQGFLQGDYPNTPLVKDLFPSDDTTNSGICVPVPFGTAYVPLQSVFIENTRYYLLGPTATTATVSYNLHKITSPSEWFSKSTWTSSDYSFNQYTKTDLDLNDWIVFQPIIADSDDDGTADAPGLWKQGDVFLNPSVKFTRSDTLTKTSFADVLKYILEDFGIPSARISTEFFNIAKGIYVNWGIFCNYAFYYKRSRREIISLLLNSCNSVLRSSKQIELVPLTTASQATITSSIVLQESLGKTSFKYKDVVTKYDYDSGYVAYQEDDAPQNTYYNILVPCKDSETKVSSEILEIPFIQNSIKVQKLGCLYYQYKFLIEATVSFKTKGDLIQLNPGEFVTVSNSAYGGTYSVLIEQMHISKDLQLSFNCSKFSDTIDSFEELTFSEITNLTDNSYNVWQPIISGPASSPSVGNQPNLLPGKVYIGDNIFLDPTGDGRIRVYNADNFVQLTPSGLVGYDSILGTTFKLLTDGSPPEFSSGIIKESEYQIYTSGVIKTSANPSINGGFLVNNTELIAYDDSGLKTFNVIYNGTDKGDFYIGDFDNNNEGIKYDHSEGKLYIRGGVEIQNMNFNYIPAQYSSFDGTSLPPMTVTSSTTSLATGGNIGDGCLLIVAAGANNQYFGSSSSDYNLRLSANKKWLLSAYAQSQQSQVTGSLGIKLGASAGSASFTFVTTSTTSVWKRVYGVLDFSAVSEKTGILKSSVVSGAGTSIKLDGIMLTPTTNDTEIPDYYIPGATTYLDGGLIRTGTLNANVCNIININASNINTGTLNASVVNVTNINASNITTGTLNANLIGAGTINAYHVGTNELIVNGSNIRDLIISTAKLAYNSASSYYATYIPGNYTIGTFYDANPNWVTTATISFYSAGEPTAITYSACIDIYIGTQVMYSLPIGYCQLLLDGVRQQRIKVIGTAVSNYYYVGQDLYQAINLHNTFTITFTVTPTIGWHSISIQGTTSGYNGNTPVNAVFSDQNIHIHGIKR